MKMKALFVMILLGGISFMGSDSARGQESIEIIGTLRFAKPDGSLAKSIRYGVGTNYTDTTDLAEVEVPIVPPVNLYAWFNRVCDGEFSGDPCQWEQDYRGVPDSVTEEEVPAFHITYDVGLRNETGGTILMSILNPDWPDGVDSIHVEDAVLPRAFTHTFTGPVEVELEDPLTTRLKVTVYFNLEVSSVTAGSVQNRRMAGLGVLPNPSGANEISVSASFNPGDRLLVTDMLGKSIREVRIAESIAKARVNTEGVPAGEYLVLRLNEKGEVVGSEHLRIVR